MDALDSTISNSMRKVETLSEPYSIKSHAKFKAVIYILKPEENGLSTPFTSKNKPLLCVKEADVMIESIEFYDWEERELLDMASPGDNIIAVIRLINGIGMAAGMRFTLREGGKMIGAGVISEVFD